MTATQIQKTKFPEARDLWVNMMPIRIGEPLSIPDSLRQYQPMIDQCGLPAGTIGYLTVRESTVRAGASQSRPGLHTEGWLGTSWGEFHWGGRGGLFVAATDSTTRAYDCRAVSTKAGGSIDVPIEAEAQMLEENTIYKMSDTTPHECTPADSRKLRQFFRLVSENVSVWYAMHSTNNPMGVSPGCRIEHHSKF